MLKLWPALWTFAGHDGVQPTNNHAERALRGAVIYRKLSLGSQSEDVERRIARPLSAHPTCRLQRRSLHAYVIDALRAHTRGDPVPLLALTAPGSLNAYRNHDMQGLREYRHGDSNPGFRRERAAS